MLLVIWFSFRYYCDGQEVEFNDPCEFLPTWDILWFFEDILMCVKKRKWRAVFSSRMLCLVLVVKNQYAPFDWRQVPYKPRGMRSWKCPLSRFLWLCSIVSSCICITWANVVTKITSLQSTLVLLSLFQY